MHTVLAAVSADYVALRARHIALHSAMYDRPPLDLNVPAADRQLSTTELIVRQNANRNTLDLALLERLYDGGRYLFIRRSSTRSAPDRHPHTWWGRAAGRTGAALLASLGILRTVAMYRIPDARTAELWGTVVNARLRLSRCRQGISSPAGLAIVFTYLRLRLSAGAVSELQVVRRF